MIRTCRRALLALLLATPLAAQTAAPSDSLVIRQYEGGVLTDSLVMRFAPRVTLVVTPPPAPAPPASSHEPTGWTRLSTFALDSVRGDGWYLDGAMPGRALATTEGERRFMRALFKTGDGSSTTPFRIQRNLQGPRFTKLYWAFDLRASLNFYGHPTATNKIGFAWTGGGIASNPYSANIFFLSAEGVGTGPLTLTPRIQTTGLFGNLDVLPGRVADATFTRGAWHRVEVELWGGTPGAADGRLRLWLDGRLVWTFDAIPWRSTLEQRDWEYLDFTPLYGGAGGSVPADMALDYDNAVVSGAP